MLINIKCTNHWQYLYLIVVAVVRTLQACGILGSLICMLVYKTLKLASHTRISFTFTSQKALG